MDVATTLDFIRTWPLKDQMELAQEIWDRAAEAGELPDIDAEKIAELNRRLAAADANPQDVISWETIEAHVLRKR